MSDRRLVLITPPTADVVARDDVKRHLRVEHAEDDALIDLYIAAAVAMIDPAAGGWLGRALRPQTWELRLDAFPACGIVLPYPPAISVTSVTYDDADGVAQTLAAGTGYRVIGSGGADAVELRPPFGGSWPSARATPESVRIRYQCGHAAATPDPLPAAIRAWLFLVVGTLYAHRESITSAGAALADLPDHIRTMLTPYRAFAA